MRESPLRAADLRIHNQNIVLSQIHRSGNQGISQSEVVNNTGLKAPTIFRVFAALEEQGLILPTNHVNSDSRETARKGRRPQFYTIKKDACYTIGLEFWTAFMSFGIYDFSGEKIYSDMRELEVPLSIFSIVDAIVKQVEIGIETSKIDKDLILGLGIAAPGQVDLVKRSIVSYPNIADIENYPLADVLEERLEIPVLLHNNCSALGYGVYHEKGSTHEDSLFTFLLRSGVNGSFVHNGVIYTNSRGLTIESGHIPISLDGPLCSCGMHGCLEVYLQRLDDCFSIDHCLLFEKLEERMQSDPEGANAIVEQAAFYLYKAMITIIRLLGPKTFMIVACSDVVAELIASRIRLHFSTPDIFTGSAPSVHSLGYNPFCATKGASDLVLSDFFNS